VIVHVVTAAKLIKPVRRTGPYPASALLPVVPYAAPRVSLPLSNATCSGLRDSLFAAHRRRFQVATHHHKSLPCSTPMRRRRQYHSSAQAQCPTPWVRYLFRLIPPLLLSCGTACWSSPSKRLAESCLVRLAHLPYQFICTTSSKTAGC
jgi:hypothetical protein